MSCSHAKPEVEGGEGEEGAEVAILEIVGYELKKKEKKEKAKKEGTVEANSYGSLLANRVVSRHP